MFGFFSDCRVAGHRISIYSVRERYFCAVLLKHYSLKCFNQSPGQGP